jgi:hypothetical protein
MTILSKRGHFEPPLGRDCKGQQKNSFWHVMINIHPYMDHHITPKKIWSKLPLKFSHRTIANMSRDSAYLDSLYYAYCIDIYLIKIRLQHIIVMRNKNNGFVNYTL